MYGDNQGIKAESHPFTIEDVPLHDHQQELAHSVSQIPYGSHHWLKQQYANGLMTPPNSGPRAGNNYHAHSDF